MADAGQRPPLRYDRGVVVWTFGVGSVPAAADLVSVRQVLRFASSTSVTYGTPTDLSSPSTSITQRKANVIGCTGWPLPHCHSSDAGKRLS